MAQSTVNRTAREDYERDGFYLAPSLVDRSCCVEATAVMDQVIAGDYLTGRTPNGVLWRPGDDPTALAKINQPQVADPAITELLVRSRIGEWAAALTGAEMVQVWAVQLLYKPPGSADRGNVGWHQDDDYWTGRWDGEVFTCWLALSDVTEESGAMRFVRGSHRWGHLASGDFLDQDLERTRAQFPVPEGAEWVEVPAVMKAGAASFHHRTTIHGSGPNTSNAPRRSYAIHLRTERSRELEGSPPAYRQQLSDPAICPVLYRRSPR